jgi:K319-like protein
MTRLFNRLRGARMRTKVFGLSAMLVLVAGVAVAAPSGVLTPGSGVSGGITTVGPVNPNNGFPDWYRDTNGVDLMPCDDPQDPNCPAVATPDPTAPVDFPGNFPEEFFYAQADTQNLTSNGGVQVLAQFSLEGAFLNGGPAAGDQMVFDRIRYKILSGLQPGKDYKITQPYGTDTVTADDAGGFFVTQDVGAVAGDFAAALKGRIGPFLHWDTGAPAGYLGDGITPHKVLGSEIKDASGNLQNYVRIDGPGIGGANNPNPCPGLTATTSPDCIYTNTFNIIGKQAINQGADVAKATYEKDALGQNAYINVLSNSGNQQHIEVQDGDNGPGVNRLFPTTPLRNLGGRYFARVAVPNALPASVDVVNKGDVPQTVTHVKLTDDVQASAVYHVTTAGPDSLHVTATSSDKTLDGTALTVGQYNTKLAANGQLDIPTDAPAANVTVTSSQGGSVTVPVVIDGQGLAPTKLAAAAGPDDTVSQGSTVTLDGAGSTGNINTYQWTQDPADTTQVSLKTATSAQATFTAPLTQTDLHFTLTITGPNGTSDSDQVTITTKANLGAHAAITPVDSLVLQNLPITLDGSTSDGVRYEWSQVSGPTVNLGAANAKTETFLFPKMANPTAIVIQLRVRSASDTTASGSSTCPATVCDTAQITLNPAIDNLNGSPIVAKYDSSKQRWVVSGSSNILTSNNVRVHNGSAVGADGFPNGAVIGSALVDPTGAWKIDVRGSTITPGTGANRVISVESDRGGKVLSIAVP